MPATLGQPLEGIAIARKTLTEAAVKRLKPPVQGQRDIFDQGFPGFALRISYGGGKSFVFLYRVGRRTRRLTLGTYPALTLAEARDAWREARLEVAKGRDPARKDGKAATDFRGVFEEWLLRDQGENRSKALVARKLEKDVLPFWQHRPISDIGRRDALDVIDRIADRGAVITARRVHAHLHRLFKWAVGRGIIDFNPLASVPKPGSETKRDRVLSDEELVAVWKAADEIGHPYGSIIKLLILTGCRREEIGQLKWSEIDGDKIVLGGQRTKNGEAHIIPLSAPACAIIEDLPRIAGCEFVITHNGVKPVAAWGRAKALIDAIANIAPWVVHDLRRTTATGLQKLGTPLQVTEAVLGHTGGSRAGVVGIYQRHDYANEKRTALEVWGAHVMALVEGRAPRQDLRLPPSDEDQQTPLLAADGS